MDLSETLKVRRAWHKLRVIQFWAWSGRNPGFWTTLKFALKGAYGNRWQSEDGDATWRIALPWQRYLRAMTAYLVNYLILTKLSLNSE